MVGSAHRFSLNWLTQTFFLSGMMLTFTGCGGDEAAKTDAASDSGAAAASDPSNASGAGPAAAAGGMPAGPSAAMDAPGGAAMPMGPPGGMPGNMSMGPPGGMSGSMPMSASGTMNPANAAGMMMSGPGFPGTSGPGGLAGGAPATPSRPASYAAWTNDDFENAVRERDTKVLDAIDAKVKAAPGDPKVADLLASLLVVSTEPPKVNSNGAVGGAAGYLPSGSSDPSAGLQGPPGGPGMRSSVPPPSGGSGPPGRPSIQSGPQPGAPGIPAAPGAVPPQSRLKSGPNNSLAVDSLALMLAEAATAYQSAPAVGAIAGRMEPGAILAAQPPGTGGAAQSSVPPGSFNPGAAPDDGAMNANMPGEPGGFGGGPGGYPGMPGGGGGANGGLNDRQLVEQIVNGLIRNKSPKAWMTVHGIAAGSIQTPLDLPASAEIVVRELFRNLADNPAEIEQVILALIDGKGGLPANSRSACMKAITEISASATDRITGLQSVAAATGQSGPGGMMGPGMSGPGGMMGPGMSGPGGMMGPGMSAPGMSGPGMSSRPPGVGVDMAAGGMVGVDGAMPGAPGGGFGSSNAATSSDLPEAVVLNAAAMLWSPRNVEIIAKQLESAADPVTSAEILLLAATIPNNRMREAELAAFTQLHAAGADSLSQSGLFSIGAHDPGMLVVLKSLPRQKPPRVPEGQTAPPMDSWTAAGEEMVLSFRDRLRALSSQPGKLTPTSDAFPVRFHKNATAEFTGMMSLPGPTGADLKDSAPSETRVYYARIPFSPRREKDQQDVVDHYVSKASGFRRLDEAKGVLWIDGVKAGQSGTKRSMDVIIQSASAGGQGVGEGGGIAGPGLGGPGAGPPGLSGPGGPGPGMMSGPGGSGGAGGGFTIEIIVVETEDPKGGAAVTEQASTRAEIP